MANTPTIASLQTPPGTGGIAVITLTGPEAWRITGEIFQPHKSQDPAAGQAGQATKTPEALQLGFLRDGEEKLDEAIVATLPGGLAEINIHGGSASARLVMRRLAKLGATVASQASPVGFDPVHPRWNNPAMGWEMLANLPKAVTLLSASAITQQWTGGLSKLARETLADIDSGVKSRALLAGRAGELRCAADGLELMRKLLDPAEVVLAGPPNAGKSTLANRLVGRAVSIVHNQAGTTRDWVREQAIVHGLAIWLTDTAGLWEVDHIVDSQAVSRAWGRIEQADLVLLMGCENTVTMPAHIPPEKILTLTSKADALPSHQNSQAAQAAQAAQGLRVSAVTGEGIDALKNAILTKLGLCDIDPAKPRAFTERQANLLNEAAQSISQDNLAEARNSLTHLLE